MMTAIQPDSAVRIQAGLNRTKLREKTLGFYFISSSHDFRMRPSVPVTSAVAARTVGGSRDTELFILVKVVALSSPYHFKINLKNISYYP